MARRHRFRWLVGCGTALALLSAAACIGIAPQSFRRVKEPREGRPMNRRVAIVFSERYQIDLPGAQWVHVFDTRKYARIFLKLNAEGYLRPEDAFVPAEATREEILRAHTPAHLEALGDPGRVAVYMEAPIVSALPAGLVDRHILRPHRYSSAGTKLAGRLALEHGIAINLGGGYHHAMPDRGGGFCVYNDLAMAVRTLQAEGRIRRALIVDLDVHQGNGTAVCFQGDDDVFTFSMHQGDIYPVPKAESDLDIELPAGTGDAAYLAILDENLPVLFERARPEIVFLQAGCDAVAGDPLAGLAMGPDGIVRRDARVVDACVERGVPVVMTLGGGYTKDSWAIQYDSVVRTIRTYGLATGGPPHPPRDPTAKERLYTK